MTVEREEPELVIAVCDGCGERRILDLDQDAPKEEIGEALLAIGWVQRAPERQRFVGNFDRGHVVTYAQDFCADCQSDEPKPAPLIVPGRAYRHGPIDAFANDPIDEWPRAAIWAALGLNPMCGHPKPHPCAHCEAGFPLGRTDQRWRR